MGSSKKIAKGVFWTTLGNIINGIYGFISVPILIAYFGKSDYGLIGLALSVNIYLRLMDMGLNGTNVRFFSNWIAKGETERVRRLFGTSLSFYGSIGLLNAIVLLIVSYFSNDIFNLNDGQYEVLQHLFYILSISAFVSWFTSCFAQIINANELVGWNQKVHLLPKLIQVFVLFFTVYARLSIELYYMLTAFSMFIIIPIMVRKIQQLCPYISFIPHFDKEIFREILPYCLNIFSFSIFQFSIYNLRPVLLGIRGTIESVAEFRILNGILSIVMMLGGAFAGVILPFASKVVAKNDVDAYNRVAYQGTKFISIALCFCCFGMISVSHEVLTIYVGKEYLYLIPWLVIWLLLTTLRHNQAMSSLILAGSDIRAITYSTIVASVMGVIVCWFTIPYFQIGGTVIGFAVYNIIQIVFYYTYYWPQKMNIDSLKLFTKSYMTFMIIGAVLSYTAFVISVDRNPYIAFAVKGFCFAILYLFLAFLCINAEDRLFLKKLIVKQSNTKS